MVYSLLLRSHNLGIDCFMPANGETIMITTQSDIPVKVSDRLLKRTLEEYNGKSCVTKSHHYTRVLHTASNI